MQWLTILTSESSIYHGDGVACNAKFNVHEGSLASVFVQGGAMPAVSTRLVYCKSEQSPTPK